MTKRSFLRVSRRARTMVLMIAMTLLGIQLASASDTNAPLSIEGYSPVSYFTEGKAEKGSPEFAVRNGGFTYYLTSAEQVALFERNPDQYRPRYEICPYSLTSGKKLPLDPTNFKVIGDALLLFHKSESMDGLDLWNNSDKDDETLIGIADKQYTLLRF